MRTLRYYEVAGYTGEKRKAMIHLIIGEESLRKYNRLEMNRQVGAYIGLD